MTRNCIIAKKNIFFYLFWFSFLLFARLFYVLIQKQKLESMRKMSIENCLFVGKFTQNILTDVTFRFSNHRHVFLTLTLSFSLDLLSLALDSAIKKTTQHTSTTLFKDVYVNVTFLALALTHTHSLSLRSNFLLL